LNYDFLRRNSFVNYAVPVCFYFEGDLGIDTMPPVSPLPSYSSSNYSKVFGLLTGIGISSTGLELKLCVWRLFCSPGVFSSSSIVLLS
jgi:hypothetical protein